MREDCRGVSAPPRVRVALQERENPDLLAKTPSRRRRIARGAGRTQTDVSGLLTSFTGMRSRMNQLSSMMKMQGGAQPLLCKPGGVQDLIPALTVFRHCSAARHLCSSALLTAARHSHAGKMTGRVYR